MKVGKTLSKFGVLLDAVSRLVQRVILPLVLCTHTLTAVLKSKVSKVGH